MVCVGMWHVNIIISVPLTRDVQGNYFISFTILSESLEDTSFHLNGIHVVNVILEYFYLGLLVLCYILALGNRPQGAKWLYTVAMIGFAIITVYMTVRSPITLVLQPH